MPDTSFRDLVLDQLAALGGVECRAMFGGHGLSHGGVFFGIVHRERLYFRTHGASRPAYEAAGMGPFRPNTRQTLTSYYEVPADVLEDADRLTDWARQAAAPETRPTTSGRQAAKPKKKRRAS